MIFDITHLFHFILSQKFHINYKIVYQYDSYYVTKIVHEGQC